MSRIAVVLVAAALAGPAGRFAVQLHRAATTGAGGTASQRWRDSPVVHELRRRDPATVYTNEAARLIVLMDRPVVRIGKAALAALGSERASAGALVAWFDEGPEGPLTDDEVARLVMLAGLSHVWRGGDGLLIDLSRGD